MVKRKSGVLIFVLALMLVVTAFFAPGISKANGMQIFIEIPQESGTNRTITLEVEPTDRIEDVLAKIYERESSWDMSTVHLIYAGRCIIEDEGNTLQDWSIQKESRIYVYFTSEHGCHSTPNCDGVYVDDECCTCKQDISVVYDEPTPNDLSWILYLVIGVVVLIATFATILVVRAVKRSRPF